MAGILSRAAVKVAPKEMEVQELALPDLPADAGILRVLSAGICGADYPQYGDPHSPRILGHENIGTIEWLGDLAAERWGVQVGDYVALEEYLPCGSCGFCRSGEYRACQQTNHSSVDGALRYGSTKLSVWPGLWGGYSQFQYLHPRAVLHKIPAGVPPRMAAMALPLGNGFQWAVFDGKAGLGDTVVIQGPGQQGLACAVAARAAGARKVIVTGLARDEQRLAVAKKLGADHVVKVDIESLRDRIRDFTNGQGADLVLDVSSGGATEVINTGIDILKSRYGRFIVAAGKKRLLDGLDFDAIIRKAVTLRGVRGHSFQAVEMGLALMATRAIDLEVMSTHEFGLDDADRAVRLAGGEIRDANGDAAIHVTINPWQ